MQNSNAATRGRILGRNWDKSLQSFPPCYSQSHLLLDFTPPPPLSKGVLELVCNVNIVYGNLNSENSQVYAQKPQKNCTFMNSASQSTWCSCYMSHNMRVNTSAGIFKQSMGAGNRVGMSYWSTRLYTQPGEIGSLESILGLLKSLKIRARCY